MRRIRIAAIAVAVVLLAACAPSEPEERGETVTVFAAASLTETFDRIAAAVEEENPGSRVVLNYGGSASLAQQIVQGAPADVFAAASTETMQIVDDAGLAESAVVFVRNTLQIAVPAGNPAGVTGLADLARDDLRIALCSEEVPCGAAAATALEAADVTAAPDTLQQDVKAVLTKVRLGEVDAGLVYRTDVIAAGDEVEGIEFAEAADATTDYPITVLTDAPNPSLANAFVGYVRSPDGRFLLDDAGFAAP